MKTLVLLLVSTAVLAQSAHVDYDVFMQGDRAARIRTFQTMTPDNKAEVVRTHIDRWLAVNRNRLTAEQVTVVEENRAFVTAELYERPRTPGILARSKELETRALAVLSRQDAGQAFTIEGAYIPKP
jgi:hypothetical protein